MKRLLAPIVMALAVTLAAATAGCAKRAVAKVNGTVITEQEFFDRLQAADGRQVLDRLILEALIAQKAKEKNLQVADAEVDKFLEDFKKQAGGRWEEFLRMSGQTAEDIKRDVRDNLLVAKLVFPESELKKYWEESRDRFDEPATVTYRRIILPSKGEAEKVRSQIESGKLTFAEAVKTRSQDPLAQQRGGEVGPVREGFGDPALNQVLFSLPLNKVSEPIKATFPEGAYELVEVQARTEGKKVSFEDTRPRVIQALMAARQQEVAQFVNDLRANASVTVFSQRFQSLQEEYAKRKEQKPPQIPTTPSEKPQVTPAKPEQPTPSEAK